MIPSDVAEPIELRDAAPGDRDAILRLLSASLGWVPDELFADFFSWKHEESPAGTSPAWVAESNGQVIGFRTFMRWQFTTPSGQLLRAARAVDTATHPDHQGRGVFRKLTLHAVDSMVADGVDFVFNTPNEKSRPGYLKMGWTVVGKVPVAVRASSPAAMARMVRSKVAADRWSTPCTAGLLAAEALSDPAVDQLVHGLPAPTGLRTLLSPAYLRWRYGFEPHAYRAILLSRDPAEGLAIFRVRSRGKATEAGLCQILAPGGERNAVLALERAVARYCGADYVIRVGGAAIDRAGYVRLPKQGPVLTRRPLVDPNAGANLGDWDLSLGDVELF